MHYSEIKTNMFSFIQLNMFLKQAMLITARNFLKLEEGSKLKYIKLSKAYVYIEIILLN